LRPPKSKEHQALSFPTRNISSPTPTLMFSSQSACEWFVFRRHPYPDKLSGFFLAIRETQNILSFPLQVHKQGGLDLRVGVV